MGDNPIKLSSDIDSCKISYAPFKNPPHSQELKYRDFYSSPTHSLIFLPGCNCTQSLGQNHLYENATTDYFLFFMKTKFIFTWNVLKARGSMIRNSEIGYCLDRKANLLSKCTLHTFGACKLKILFYFNRIWNLCHGCSNFFYYIS